MLSQLPTTTCFFPSSPNLEIQNKKHVVKVDKKECVGMYVPSPISSRPPAPSSSNNAQLRLPPQPINCCSPRHEGPQDGVAMHALPFPSQIRQSIAIAGGGGAIAIASASPLTGASTTSSRSHDGPDEEGEGRGRAADEGGVVGVGVRPVDGRRRDWRQHSRLAGTILTNIC